MLIYIHVSFVVCCLYATLLIALFIYLYKGGRQLFDVFLQQEHSEENLMFWGEVNKLRTVTEPKEHSTAAKHIYLEFLKPMAAKEVFVIPIPVFLFRCSLFSTNLHVGVTFSDDNCVPLTYVIFAFTLQVCLFHLDKYCGNDA